MPIDFILFAVVLIAYSVYIAYMDWLYYRIPNIPTFSMVALGVIFHTAIYFSGYNGYFASQEVFGKAGMDPMWSLLGVLACGGFLFIPWVLGGAGAGDVKYLAAMGAWWGIYYGFFMFAVSMIIAAFAAIVFWIIKKLAGKQSQGGGSGGKKSRKEQSMSKKGKGNTEAISAIRKANRPVVRALPYAVPCLLANIILLIYTYILYIK